MNTGSKVLLATVAAPALMTGLIVLSYEGPAESPIRLAPIAETPASVVTAQDALTSACIAWQKSVPNAYTPLCQHATHTNDVSVPVNFLSITFGLSLIGGTLGIIWFVELCILLTSAVMRLVDFIFRRKTV
jgi:hypothetical protein